MRRALAGHGVEATRAAAADAGRRAAASDGEDEDDRKLRAATLACNMGACCAALGFDGVAGLHLCNALPGLPDGGERDAAACHNLGLVALRQGRYESAFQYVRGADLP